ncbi:hypothetical protein [Fulvivirga sediminis]|uniref:Exostosin GT47 domain-containing protein n=1 Tax=Fulvivirga sediminis TaxID=2803949 RepID=A0A937F4P6_9BACT|nr:hypothetical protein [Fulvivirga sediminis]MBL3654832.1 hypothetical protein [Fulvivirga sediminis]
MKGEISNKPLYFEIPDSTLQVFFVILAYAEQNPDKVYLFDESNHSLLQACQKFLSLKLKRITDENEAYSIFNIRIDHSKPETQLLNLSAPLIFPKIIVNRFYKKANLKDHRLYFRGILTKPRFKECMLMFLTIKDFSATFQMVRKSLKSKSFQIDTEKVYFDFTDRGRQKEFKYLDDNYYREMSGFKYVFCPKGDFTWTYRFFEAIQLGAIPICKHKHSLYNDFYYYRKIDQSSNHNALKLIEQNLTSFKSKFYLKDEGFSEFA